jgi:hypothetical protein
VLKFNTLLVEAGVDPERAFLLRHQDSRIADGRTIYSVWRFQRPDFEFYQRIQRWENRFETGAFIASFIVTPDGDTLFVGLYEVTDLEKTAESIFDPLIRHDVPAGCAFHTLEHRDGSKDFEERLIIDWGRGGERAWRQRAHLQNKDVIAIKRAIGEPEFPGFHDVICDTDRIEETPPTWRNLLRSVKGVYLLVCKETGEQYVGAAYGDEGFWGRWSAYASNGHGGNALLNVRAKHAYAATILEIVDSNATPVEIINAEARWKRKLGSRAYGLNVN